MKTRSLSALVAAVASISLAATACSSPTNEDDPDDQTTQDAGEAGGGGPLSVGWNQPFYSWNSNTTNGNNVTNANVAYLTTGNFAYYDAEANLQQDETYGTYEKVSDDPLTIKYTFADDNEWSDGAETDAADLLLYWAAASGNFNSIAADKVQRDETSYQPTNTRGEVFFDAAAYTPGLGLSLVTEFPEVSDDGKSVTLKYDKPYADWELDFGSGTILPAHIVAKEALGVADPEAGKEAIIKALQDEDKEALTKVSQFWNTGWDFTSKPKDGLVVSNGAFTLANARENQFVTLERNEQYEGMMAPKLDEITIRFNEDPTAQLQALQNGEIAMMYPQVTADVVNGAEQAGLEVITKPEGTYEHMDLTLNNGGPFDPATYGGDEEKAKLVRQAFFKALPRQEVIDKLIKPIQDDAVVRDSILIDTGAPGYEEIIEENGSSEYAEANADEATRLLQEAGVTTPVRVRMLYAEGNERREDEFRIYKAALDQAGFQIVDNGNADWSSKLGDKSYDAVFFAWQSTSTAVTNSTSTWITGGGNNFQGYSNPEVDRLFDEVSFTTDEEEKSELVTQLDQQIIGDAVSLGIFQFPSATIYDGGAVTNVEPAFLSPTMFYGFWNWEKP